MTQNQEKISTEPATDEIQGSEPDTGRGKDRPKSEKMNASESEPFIYGLLGGVCFFNSATRPLSASGVLSAVLGVAFLYRALGGHWPASSWRAAGSLCRREITAGHQHWRNPASQTDLLWTVGPIKYRAEVRA
jgi:hypothetical protein